MRVRNLLPLTASLSLGLALFAFPATVHADPYEIFQVGDLQFERFYGLATDGTVVISYPGCGNLATTCYETLVSGQVTAIGLTTVPNLIYDNGTPCAPTDPPAGMTVVGEGVCNDGKEVFGTNTSGLYFGYGLYTGSDALNDVIVSSESYGPYAMNASGDVVFRYGEDGIDEAIDLTSEVPEPGGMALGGSGLLMAMAAEWVRRRRERRVEGCSLDYPVSLDVPPLSLCRSGVEPVP
jgi:hypothetical protein